VNTRTRMSSALEIVRSAKRRPVGTDVSWSFCFKGFAVARKLISRWSLSHGPQAPLRRLRRAICLIAICLVAPSPLPAHAQFLFLEGLSGNAPVAVPAVGTPFGAIVGTDSTGTISSAAATPARSQSRLPPYWARPALASLRLMEPRSQAGSSTSSTAQWPRRAETPVSPFSLWGAASFLRQLAPST
jgi:hypothetical protein